MGSKFQKSKSGFWISIFEILCAPISENTNNFEFLGQNLAKNWFWDWNFKDLSLDSESTLPIYHLCQFLVKIDGFQFFGLNLGKFANYVQYFDSNIEGVADSWVEGEMSWVEVDEAGWRWVHGSVIPNKQYTNS